MQDTDLYAQILGITFPWKVDNVEFMKAEGEIHVFVSLDRSGYRCVECGAVSPGYDTRHRSWRHLDSCQYKTIIEADVPRIKCKEHGVHEVKVPWAAPGSRFTLMFERLVIDLLQEIKCISTVAARANLTWDEVDGVMQRAVARGMERRRKKQVFRIGLDETAVKRGHEYFTLVHDKDSKDILYVGEDRTNETVEAFYEEWDGYLRKVSSVSMDLWKPFIEGARRHVEFADGKICFDKFHIMSFFNKAVDEVRKKENAMLLKEGNDLLKGTKYDWLRNAKNVDGRSRQWFCELTRKGLKTARAWAIKEMAGRLWDYVSPTCAEKAWRKLLGWMSRSRLEPMKELVKTIKTHFYGIMNAIRLKADNADAESLNTKIQKIKNFSCGFRNKERFKNAIYFYLGGLDLYPA